MVASGVYSLVVLHRLLIAVASLGAHRLWDTWASPVASGL